MVPLTLFKMPHDHSVASRILHAVTHCIHCILFVQTSLVSRLLFLLFSVSCFLFLVCLSTGVGSRRLMGLPELIWRQSAMACLFVML